MPVLICQFCENDEDRNGAELDPIQNGFWCSVCDGYTYLHPAAAEHRFTLILEDDSVRNSPIPKVNISLNKRLSPLRYPGGKSKIIPLIYSKLQEAASRTLVGAFSGGASVELSLLHAGVIQELILNDLDYGIYSLFYTIKHDPDELIRRIQQTVPTHDHFFAAQSIVKAGYHACTIIEAAWALLLVNRLAYSGIYKANPLGGRSGCQKDLLSRWNPDDLCRRIRLIHAMSDRITVLNMDACELIEEYYWRNHTTIFLDPPYIKQGKQLYRCYYNRDDHMELSQLLDSLFHGMPGADLILIYDNDPLIEDIYTYPVVEKFCRVYSV
jgi:DNA adenine methylase